MASNLNSILVEGLLKADAETRVTPEGEQVCAFQLLTRRVYKEGETARSKVSCFDVEARGALAKACGAKGVKGIGCRVVGRLDEDCYTGADGRQYSRVVIIAEHAEFRYDNRQDAAIKGDPPCGACPMSPDCEGRRQECGAYRAYLGAKAAKKQGPSKKRARGHNA